MDGLGEFLKQIGYGTPLIYAAAAYGLFYWLDENLSDAAKAALAGTMKFKNTDNKQVAAAIVEVFDRIYTRPLLSWRAFLRSVLFTFLVTVAYAYEYFNLLEKIISLTRTTLVDHPEYGLTQLLFTFKVYMVFWGGMFLTNVVTDYVSLFVIRRWLMGWGAKPIFALVLGTFIGTFIVNVGALVRIATASFSGHGLETLIVWWEHSSFFYYLWEENLETVVPAMIVFVWLPLLALGILVMRAAAPVSWVLTRLQWALTRTLQRRHLGFAARRASWMANSIRSNLVIVARRSRASSETGTPTRTS